MSVCSELCQHPACWKAEIDNQRQERLLQLLNEGHITVQQLAAAGQMGFINNIINKFKQESLSAERKQKKRSKIEALPELHLVNFTQQFDRDNSISPESTISTTSLPSRKPLSADNSLHGIAPANSVAGVKPASATQRRIKKIRARHEHKTLIKPKADQYIGPLATDASLLLRGAPDHIQRVLVWMPGKRKKKEREKSATDLSFKTIDGKDLPKEEVLKPRDKSPRRNAGDYFNRPPRHLPPLDVQTMDPYRLLELLEYPKTALLHTRDNIDRGTSNMPSPLKAAPIRRPQSQEEDNEMSSSSEDEELMKEERVWTETIVDGQKLSEDEDDVDEPVWQESPVEQERGRERTRRKSRYLRDRQFNPRLPLTTPKVSVPKRIIKQYPFHDHCQSSIRQTEFPDVIMQPLSGSEKSSTVPSEMSVRSDMPIDLSNEPMVANESFNPIQVPAPSPESMDTRIDTGLDTFGGSRSLAALQLSKSNSQINLPEKVACLSEAQLYQTEKLSQQLENGPIPQTNEPDVPDDRLKSRPSVSFNFPTLERVAQTEYRADTVSPEVSLLSKPSSEAGKTDRTDKELIQQTYDKYKSFTPYKTPLPSSHIIDEETKVGNNEKLQENHLGASQRPLSPQVSGRVVLPQSMHNLDQFLPDSMESIAPKTSFIKKDLSPSRSMFHRQPMQPGKNVVPWQLSVSCVRFNKSRHSRTAGENEMPPSYLSDRSVSANPGMRQPNLLGDAPANPVIPSVSCTPPMTAPAPAPTPDSMFHPTLEEEEVVIHAQVPDDTSNPGVGDNEEFNLGIQSLIPSISFNQLDMDPEVLIDFSEGQFSAPAIDEMSLVSSVTSIGAAEAEVQLVKHTDPAIESVAEVKIANQPLTSGQEKPSKDPLERIPKQEPALARKKPSQSRQLPVIADITEADEEDALGEQASPPSIPLQESKHDSSNECAHEIRDDKLALNSIEVKDIPPSVNKTSSQVHDSEHPTSREVVEKCVDDSVGIAVNDNNQIELPVIIGTDEKILDAGVEKVEEVSSAFAPTIQAPKEVPDERSMGEKSVPGKATTADKTVPVDNSCEESGRTVQQEQAEVENSGNISQEDSTLKQTSNLPSSKDDVKEADSSLSQGEISQERSTDLISDIPSNHHEYPLPESISPQLPDEPLSTQLESQKVSSEISKVPDPPSNEKEGLLNASASSVDDQVTTDILQEESVVDVPALEQPEVEEEEVKKRNVFDPSEEVIETSDPDILARYQAVTESMLEIPEITDSQLALPSARGSSPYFVPPSPAPDFSAGVNLDMDMGEEVRRAVSGLDRLSSKDDYDANSGFSIQFDQF